MDIDVKELSDLLCGSLIGNRIVFLEEVGSTNDYASELAGQGAPEGTVVIADRQKEGKGRLGRTWQSPPYVNLYTSVILRPDIEPEVSPRITLVAGIAVAETLIQYCREGVSLKWPNDVLINGKKVCGILTEMKSGEGKVDFIVVGVGVNINMLRHEFDEELRECATSLRQEIGTEVHRPDFIVRLFDGFGRWYRIFLSGDFEAVRERWTALSGMAGRHVRITSRDRTETGVVTGMSERGGLLIQIAGNGVKEIISGDVTYDKRS
ncbi:MAG: biotin--[acetyl-CoA-carboxylase] ligase [Syntrophales bacterium]